MSACEAQKAGATGLHITPADLFSCPLPPRGCDIYPDAAICLTNGHDAQLFRGPVAPPCLFPALSTVMEQDGGGDSCAGERRGLLVWVIPQACLVVDKAGARGAVPAPKHTVPFYRWRNSVTQ